MENLKQIRQSGLNCKWNVVKVTMICHVAELFVPPWCQQRASAQDMCQL